MPIRPAQSRDQVTEPREPHHTLPREPPGGTAERTPGVTRRASHPLNEADTRALLERNYWGVLATVGDDQPYAIPIIYGLEDNRFYAVLGSGRKTANLDRNPSACLTVVELEDMARRWRSAIVLGRVSWVTESAAVAAAIEVIRRQYPGLPTRSQQGVETLAAMGFRVACITADQITGRAQD